MLQDLAVLTPSLLVCAAFLTGVIVLLRREMAPRQRNREGDGSSEDIAAECGISESEDGTPATSDRGQTADPQTGSRSRD